MFYKCERHKNRRYAGFLSAVLSVLFAVQSPVRAIPSAAECIPKNAVISVEIARPKALLEFFTGEKVTKALTALPAYKNLTSTPKFSELQGIIGFVEATLQADWRTGIAKLTGGGVTFAVCPDDIVVLIVDAEDEQMLGRIHEFFLDIARGNGYGGEVESGKDVTAWTFDGKSAHTIIGKRFVFASSLDGLKAVLELRDKSGSENLTSKPGYQSARRSAGADAAAIVFADMTLLKYVPEISSLLQKSTGNPLAALAFAGIIEAVQNSSRLGFGLHTAEDKLILDASVDGNVGGAGSSAAFALPKKSDQGVMPNLSVPRRLAAMSLYRDLHEFYAAKDELFPERTSGLIFFENMMGIFFSGRDLTNEVLAETGPEIRLVAAEQQYDASIGRPAVELPAFAAVFRLRNPESFKAVAEEAWQKAIGLVNFTRGQQAMPGLIIDRPTQGETKFTVAYFSSADAENKAQLAQRFNFRPSIAMPGDYLVLSSTDGLARDLVDALNRETKSPPASLAGTHSEVEIDSSQLASILEANRMTLVRGDMVKKGKTQAESEAGIDMLIALTKLTKGLKVSIGTDGRLTNARIELGLNLQ
ncbi:MAG: hypothetical protein JW720_12330 [Sedimentisphaerales bacterium]|nr:hypothetical protein [Sedimentisphaerales bacterium]